MSGIQGSRQWAVHNRMERDWWRRGYQHGLMGGLPDPPAPDTITDFRIAYREGYEAGVIKRLKGDA